MERIEQLLADAPAGPSTLSIIAERGMGRTALWSYAVSRARELGFRVLTIRTVEEEELLPGAALAGVIPLDEPGSTTTPAFDLGCRVLSLVREAAAGAPVLVALDDAQWLDALSANALRFAANRLIDEPVVALCTVSGPIATAALLGLPHANHLELGPLGPLPLRRILDRAGLTVTHPELLRAHAWSGGNPGVALDIVRSWRGGRARVVHARPELADLPAETVAVLQTLALAGPVPVGVIAAAVGDRIPDLSVAVRVAVESGRLVVDDDLELRFRNPYDARTVLATMNPLDRCALHARLADAIGDARAAARHRALASIVPDEALAEDLERIAADCAEHGGAAEGAELAAHAVRLTPPRLGDAAARRASAEIAYRAVAGETARALELADDLVRRLPPGTRRAHALTQRVFLDTAGSVRFLRQALAEADDDRALIARILDLLGWVQGFHAGRLAEGIGHSTAAIELADAIGDVEVSALARATLAVTSALAGRPRNDVLEVAVAEVADRQLSPLGRWPRVFRARTLFWDGRLHEAHREFLRLERDAEARGSEFQRPYRQVDLALVALAAGDLDRARSRVDAGLDAARAAGNEQGVAWLAHPLGLVAALCGDAETARNAARRLADWAVADDEPPRLTMADEVTGTLAASLGDWAAAGTAYTSMLARLDAMDYAHPGARPALVRAIEAATMIGDVTSVSSLTARLEAQASTLDAPFVDAHVLAARGQLALLRDAGEASGLLTAAADRLDELGYRFDAARVRLALARAGLRSGQRSIARTAAERAAAVFAAAGARGWVATADELLARTGGGPTRAELTATELQVAMLVATGSLNREIAGALFVGTSTVEAHLTRIYRKLGLRCRSELVGWMNSRG